ncbi:T6SS phospholipase effector Tle1-like catalytic domain-containing protein [Polyangium aurulentum]|uniref:T6SS phospholipase effector Tle1-like catalytic domain-containing protein n=1 Tax=Polyangium aurulentum TaxID=2567896 RepID=UPI0010AE51B2|nr:DUF2235 domain-containing protein [Polyangium aurulentum]UQA56818.1 DUF2235 domain-containing protein [Polyangium aurulentum]
MSAIQVALDNFVNAQALPLQAPNGERACPLGRVRIGVFFDGTGNNMWRDWGNADRVLDHDGSGHVNVEDENNPDTEAEKQRLNAPTNVAKLFRLYKEPSPPTLNKVYHHGVGSDKDYADEELAPTNEGAVEAKYGNGMAGGGFGKGGKERIQWGLNQLAQFFKGSGRAEHFFDVFGFSRGASLARDFVNAVKTVGVDNLDDQNPQVRYVEVVGINGSPTRVRKLSYERVPDDTITPKFMGIFDTVNMFRTGDTFNLYVDHSYVEHCVHLVAEDEFRMLFPLTSIFMDPNDEHAQPRSRARSHQSWAEEKRAKYQNPRRYMHWMQEIWYPGCHGDVGGAYLPRRNNPEKPDEPSKLYHLAHIPLRDMHASCIRLRVPMNPLEGLPLNMREIPDALDGAYTRYCNFRRGTEYAQHAESDTSRYVHSYPNDKYLDLFYTEMDGMFWNRQPRNPNARELQQCLQELMPWIHDSAAEFGLTAWLERGWIPRRLQRRVIYSDAQPSVGAPDRIGNNAVVRDYTLPKPER